MGEGLPYTKGMQVWASGSGGLTTDLTAIANSANDSTFEFTYSGSGDAIYIGTTQKSPDIDDLFLYYTGLQYKIVTTGSYAAPSSPSYLAELYTTASTWEARTGLQVLSTDDGYSYGNEVFSHDDANEFAIADVKLEKWATSSLFGIDARWGRIRLLQAQTVSPVFEQWIFTPNSTIINPKGQISFRGKGLFRDSILAAGNVFGESGTVVNATIPVGTGTSNPPQSWSQRYKNSLLNSNGDAIYFNITIPKGTCTAYPVRIDVYYHSDDGGSNDVDMYISALPVEVAGVLVNDPAGGKVPTPRTIANTELLTANSGQYTTFTNLDNTVNIFQKISSDDIDISQYYEGDVLLVRVELDDDGADNSDIAIVGVEVSAVKWALGERT